MVTLKNTGMAIAAAALLAVTTLAAPLPAEAHGSGGAVAAGVIGGSLLLDGIRSLGRARASAADREQDRQQDLEDDDREQDAEQDLTDDEDFASGDGSSDDGYDA